MGLNLDDQCDQNLIDELNRILEIGKLLASVLTPEEIALFQNQMKKEYEIGNTNVT